MKISIQAFKNIFQKSSTKFDRRLTKVDDALKELSDGVEKLKKSGGDYEPLSNEYDDLRSDMLAAEKVGEKDPKKGYEMLDVVKKKARQAALNAKNELLKPETKTDVDGIDHPVQLHPLSLPGIDKLSKEKRKEIVGKISEKISRGKDLLEKINSLDESMIEGTEPPSTKDVADLMWFLKSMAEEKAGKAFMKGALTIPDVDGKLRKYLDKCSEVYGRRSTHLKEQQKEHLGQSRGIDMYEGDLDNIDTMLPYGMKTVLTQTVRSPKGSEMLYVKMESEGARIDPLDKNFWKKGKREDTPESRKAIKKDGLRSILHGLHVIFPEGDGGLSSFREQTPENLAKAYAELISTAERVGLKAVAAELKKGYKAAKKKFKNFKMMLEHGNTIRINDMMANFESAFAKMDFNESDPNLLDKYEEMREAVAKCQLLIYESFGVNDLNERFGSEVVLNQNDLTGKKSTEEEKNVGTLKEEEDQNEMRKTIEELDKEDEEEEDDIEEPDGFWEMMEATKEYPSFMSELEEKGTSFGVSGNEIKLINDAIFALNDRSVDVSALTKEEADERSLMRKTAVATVKNKIRPRMLAKAILPLLS